MELINDTKLFLSSHFEMKDLGVADIILGVKIRKNENDLSLCQSHYVEKILKKFDSFDVSPIRTPHDASKHKNKGDNVSQPEYTKIVRSVMFLMNYTRLDIAYVVSRLSRYTHNSDRYHRVTRQLSVCTSHSNVLQLLSTHVLVLSFDVFSEMQLELLSYKLSLISYFFHHQKTILSSLPNSFFPLTYLL